MLRGGGQGPGGEVDALRTEVGKRLGGLGRSGGEGKFLYPGGGGRYAVAGRGGGCGDYGGGGGREGGGDGGTRGGVL